jgi:hypothetical protein
MFITDKSTVSSWLVCIVTLAVGACTPDLERLRSSQGASGGASASVSNTESSGGSGSGGAAMEGSTSGGTSAATSSFAAAGSTASTVAAVGGTGVVPTGGAGGKASSDCGTCSGGSNTTGGVGTGGAVVTGGVNSASATGGNAGATGSGGSGGSGGSVGSGGISNSSGGASTPYGGSNSTGGLGTGGFTGPCFTQIQAPTPSILQYNFDEGSGTAANDSSGNSNAGTLQGTGWSTSGRFNGGVNFTGSNQSVRLPDNIVTGLSAITVAAWVKLSANPAGNALFDIGSSATNHFYLKVGGSGLTLGAQVNGGTVDELVTSYTLPLGVWKHVAVEVSGGQFLLYVDGLQIGQKATSFVPSALGDTTSNLLGVLIGGTVNIYGVVDDFRVYNRGLSNQEVEALAPPGTDYIHFNFDEVCGSQAHDSSDNHLIAQLPADGTWSSGRIGGSLALDRTFSQYLSLPQSVLVGCSDLTIALWVLRTSPQNWERIFVFGQGTQTSMTLAAGNTTGIMQFSSKQNGSALRGYDEQLLQSTSATQSPQSGLWAHVAVVIQSGTGRLYFNGAQVGSGTISNLPSAMGATSINTFGQPLYLQEPSYAGRLDDLRISCRAFPPNEIKILALAGQ